MAEKVEVKVFKGGKESGTRAVPSEIFGAKVSKHLLHQTVRWQRAKKRAGTHSVKTRATASGGGVKPWKQKGTGRARAGSNTSPLWVGGGVAHGPKPRSYEFSLNRKERRAALINAMSARREEGKLFVVEDFGLSEIKTKQAASVLSALGVKKGDKALVVIEDGDAKAAKSLRNIEGVTVVKTGGLNVYGVLASKYLVMTSKAVEAVQSRLS